MKTLMVSVAMGLGALLSQSTLAAEAPAAHTAQCKDGTYFDGATHKGACRGHQGVKEWLDTASKKDEAPASGAMAATETKAEKKKHKKDMAAAAAAPAAAPASSMSSGAAMPAAAGGTAAMTSAHKPPMAASQITQKAGGGAGLVWVNSESKVYHCQGDEWYGKTKQGSYMSSADAEKAGAHAAHGKACK